jgi:hypothetical protein
MLSGAKHLSSFSQRCMPLEKILRFAQDDNLTPPRLFSMPPCPRGESRSLNRARDPFGRVIKREDTEVAFCKAHAGLDAMPVQFL